AGEQLGITDTTGNFNIANVPAGLTTSITANASGYLSAVCTDVTVAAPQTDLTSVVLLSGDINDDAVVDIVDATAAGASFGQTGSNLPADITRNEIVDIFDIVAVSLNFGEAGSQTWSCLAPAPEPDPTATPEPAGGEILWSADHETGDISQWEEGQGQAIFNSNTPPGTSDIHITTDVAHSGQYALKLSITGATDGKSQGARIFRRWLDSNASPPIPLPDEAYYSAWYFFPQTYVPAEWWNIFQFKSRGEASLSMFSFNIDTSESNKMELYVYDKILGTAHSQDGTPLYISPGEWVHIEAYVKKSHLPNGRLTVWLNGQEIIDAQNIQTLRNEGDRLHW
ncbi:MAG: hypothetical protein GY796_24675, partial [Chloroflexi bacterium]|nr:hypothetical protein [Chloroflexota bacterium]